MACLFYGMRDGHDYMLFFRSAVVSNLNLELIDLRDRGDAHEINRFCSIDLNMRIWGTFIGL